MIVLSRFLENDVIFKCLLQTVGDYFTNFTVFSGDIYKKKSSEEKKKISSENNHSTGHFQSFFFLFFFVPSTLSLIKKNPVNQLIEKSGLGII